MTDHADTIRRELDDPQEWRLHDEALAALDALLAERQQAIDALREIARSRTTLGGGRETRENIAAAAAEPLRKIARAALLSLGEQP